jgi:hypothetical protein
MPRPPVKRSKLNHQNLAAKRVPNNPLSSSPAARRRQLQDQLAHKPVGRVPTDSDDSDELVTKTRNPRNRRGVPRQEIYCSGGVAQDDKVAGHKSPSHKRHQISPSNKKQQIPPKQASTVAPKVNGSRSATAPARKGLKAIDRLSTSKPADVSNTSGLRSAKPSPLGLTSSNATRVMAQETPTVESSILGPIQLRKRQPSILRLIDAPESPILEKDLDDFLPNDESTPLNASRKRKLSPTPTASAPVPPFEPPPERGVLEYATENSTAPEPELPAAPSSAASPQRPLLSGSNDDTMALPRSSSPGPTPTKVKPPSPIKKKASAQKVKAPKSLSTSALQALMPARRQQRTRRDRPAKASSEFDIPEDSSDVQNDTRAEGAGDSTADDSYLASPRPAKAGKKQAPAKLQKKKPTDMIRQKNTKKSQTDVAGMNGNTRKRKISTQSPSIKRATPSSSAAKTSSQHRDQTKIDKPNAFLPKTYSRAGKHTQEDEEEMEPEDKENRPSDSLASSSKRGRKNKPAGEPPPSIDEDDLEIEIGRRGVRAMSADMDEECKDEQARLAQKFKEVDEWEMEFEDVTFNEGSDPLAR